jgi:HEAT repeat protein
MAIDYGIEILVDSSVAADKKAELVRRVIQLLESETLSLAYATTYSAGSTSVNNNTITVGGASPDLGIRIILDTAVVGTDKAPKILRRVIQGLESETLTIAHAATYAAGDRTYNLTITVT